MDRQYPEFEKRDIDDLITNPAWEWIKVKLQERYDTLIQKLLNSDLPEAREAKNILALLACPEEMRGELEEEKIK